MRRGAGISGIQRHETQKRVLQQKGDEIAALQISELSNQLDLFKASLEKFSNAHKDEINKDSELRKRFYKMCLLLGVDPLVSRKKTIAGIMGIGDFYCELGIQIIDICVESRSLNGGFIEVNELRARLQERRKGSGDKITLDDIKTSIAQLSPLCGSYKVIKLGKRTVVQSIPYEFSQDHSDILSLAQFTSRFDMKTIKQGLGWSTDRINLALKILLEDGILWIDNSGPEAEYWVSSFFFSNY